ncbi:MAG TPA: serine/threonine-protein kinase [Thermoanaerobaculaceae bacterium]|nr:serine/threonine-protein kinase [Thermoanaerobaculaceae bacterium]
MPLEPGARLGVYHVEGLLASGGMGEVYRGRDERLERDVAIKIIAEGLASEDKELARFQREARILASLSHPNILNIFDVGEHEGTHYAVMELLRGETLRERMAKRALPWRTATAIAVAVARGLAAAHAAGIIHRDLKPENVFLLADGGVKVLDFGLAHQEVPPSDAEAPTGKPETFVGTALYMAPEQICGETPDPRTDIFGLGVLLYEMLAGTRPFGRLTVGETMSAILHAETPPMSAFGTSVPPVLERIVRRCLEKERDKRVQAAYDLAFELSEIVSSPPAQSPAAMPWRARIAWLLAGAVLGAAVTLLLMSLR